LQTPILVHRASSDAALGTSRVAVPATLAQRVRWSIPGETPVERGVSDRRGLSLAAEAGATSPDLGELAETPQLLAARSNPMSRNGVIAPSRLCERRDQPRVS
jgi:hypothetical protein